LTTKQLANSNWQLASCAPRSFQCVTTLCRPDSKNEKTRLKLSLIEALKSGKKSFDRSVDSPVELHFTFCFQQNLWGVGQWLRNAGRGSQKSTRSHVIADFAVIGKPKIKLQRQIREDANHSNGRADFSSSISLQKGR